MNPSVTVIVLAYGDEPLLPEVLGSALACTGVDVELIVVDNGYTGGDGEQFRALPLRWLEPGANTGYTGGCNRGAAAGSAALIAFLNSDAVVEPTALAALAEELADPKVGIATAQVLLYGEPGTINSVGNPVHYSLLSWAGGWGDPAAMHAQPTEPASASGALMMMRREVFEALGGFHEELFAYGEDVELSLRVWQRGLAVHYVPGSRAWHQYEFSRNPQKYYLLERNRWINLLTLYEGRTLARLAPGLVVVELGTWFAAVRSGWWRQKTQATRWVVAHRAEVRSRRRLVQAERTVGDGRILPRLATRIEPSARSGERVPEAVNALLGLFGPRTRRRARPTGRRGANPADRDVGSGATAAAPTSS